MRFDAAGALELLLAGSRRSTLPDGPDGVPLPDVASVLVGTRALRRAGYVPRRAVPQSPGAGPVDGWAEAPADAVETLAGLTTSPSQKTGALVAEWLTQAGRAHLLPPSRMWPVVLSAAEQHRAVERALEQVESGTLRWVAHQRPEWRRLLPLALDELEEGTGHQQARLVLRARREDPRALQHLSERLQGLRAQSRTRILEAVGAALPEEEPVLETLLDDRSEPVRLGAARLLSTLPASAFSRRQAMLVPQVVSRTGTLRTSVVFVPLDPLPEGGERDTLSLGRDFTPAGAQALHRLAALAPLSAWEAATGLGPAALASHAVKERKRGSSAAAATLRGWQRAARHQEDAPWAQALLEADASTEAAADLVPVLFRADRSEALARLERQNRHLGTLVESQLSVDDRDDPPGPGVTRLLLSGPARSYQSEQLLALHLGLDGLDPESVARATGPHHETWLLRHQIRHQLLGERT